MHPDGPRFHEAQGANAIVVLGCAVRVDAKGRLAAGALRRRVEAAAQHYERRGTTQAIVVASGGRRWGRSVEADVMAHELSLHGVPEHAIVRERCSLSTSDNARFSAAVLERRGLSSAAVVTCPWHLPRALALFRRVGILAEPVPAACPEPMPASHRLWYAVRERVLLQLECRGAPEVEPFRSP